MRLHSVYARFYRSLNYDFIRAAHVDYEPDPWDGTPAGDYPFVRLKLRPGITTIVGANESGKSQVLRAVEAALTGSGYSRSDLCRYSRFFGVDQVIVQPEFGVVLTDLSEEERKTMLETEDTNAVDRVALFRMNESPQVRLYIRRGGVWSLLEGSPPSETMLQSVLPAPFRIDADVPLPDSVPLEFLATGQHGAPAGREWLRAAWDTFRANSAWFATSATVQANADAISSLVATTGSVSGDEAKRHELAADLLITVAGLDRSLFVELRSAAAAKSGYANGIVDTINSELSKALNLRHWWSQDSKFELSVSLREYDLVFMIRDRTNRTYEFQERSDGMRYFLSYFVQYLAHAPRADARPEILLMDEPDRFLSSSGQQDLLRVFDDFADPKGVGRTPVQVVYVTHSPFLVDKNEVDRIRVLEKGEFDEGTRLVSNASANHYEPLRSAFGSFVAETTFIGNCNLIVEGASDQVLLAGATRWLRSFGTPSRDRLDLNRLTIVPASGTRHIPYLVYLARGRDIEKPPVIVLLDNDEAGLNAKNDLAAGGAYGDKLLDPACILQLGQEDLGALTSDNPHGIVGIEDLIPFGIALAAAARYCSEFVPDLDLTSYTFDAQAIFPKQRPNTNRGLLHYLEKAIATQSGKERFHLDKIAFARAVVEILEEPDSASVTEQEVVNARENFVVLLGTLAHAQRGAERAESMDKISSRVNRSKRDFVRTHKGQARKEDVDGLIEDIGNQLDNSPESEDCRAIMRDWRRKFELDEEPRSLVGDYPGLLRAIDQLAYSGIA